MTKPASFSGFCPHPPHAVIAEDRRAELLRLLGSTKLQPQQRDGILAGLHAAAHMERLFRSNPGVLGDLLQHGALSVISGAAAQFADSMAEARTSDAVMAAIRRYRGRVNLVIGLTDMLGLARVEDHFCWLSTAAEKAVAATADWLLDEQRKAGRDDAASGRWIILALGKLGAGELNYSSDIDLILFHDSTCSEMDSDRFSRLFVRMTRQLVKLMSQPTEDGIGWRVDLRLRPDPGATPVSINLEAGRAYYESMARTWERAAFIRARPIAGDKQAGWQFLHDISPFIWRRHLDYSVLDDMMVMLRHEAAQADYLGFNIKTGEGGIRAVEYFTHVQQLIAGGRETELRQPTTIKALEKLSDFGWISGEAALALKTAYLDLRQLEHRLQMIGDAQTHTLPKDRDGMEQLAGFCGYQDSRSMLDALQERRRQIIRHTAPLIDRMKASNLSAEMPAVEMADNTNTIPLPGNWLDADSPNGSDSPAGKLLLGLGYAHPENILPVCQAWMAGRVAATRSPRARALLAGLLPSVLDQLSKAQNPDQAFAHFARLVELLPAGVQLFSLLASNHAVTRLIATILASAPRLAETLARHPQLTDQLLYEHFWDSIGDTANLTNQLEAVISQLHADEETVLNEARIFVRERHFRIGVQALSGAISPTEAAKAFTAVAEATINTAQNDVMKRMQDRHGRLDRGHHAVLALGRLGAAEMTTTSDLDLILLYDAEEDSVSDGRKPLSARQWYTQFGKLLINSLTVQTHEGRCFEVDMRLRPSGNAGPVASHIDGFETYQRQEAWSWEHMALIRGRPITGDTILKQRIETLIRQIVAMPRDTDELANHVCRMRERIRDTKPARSGHDLRFIDCGLIDLDFLSQYLQLRFGNETNGNHNGQAAEGFLQLAGKGVLDQSYAEKLAAISRDMTDLHQLMQLALTDSRAPMEMAFTLPAPFEKRFGVSTIAALDHLLARQQAEIMPVFRQLLPGLLPN